MHNIKRYLLIFISLMIFFGCKNEVKSDFEEIKNTGAYIKIQKVQSRSILPTFDIENMTDFVFTGTKEGEQPIILGTYENSSQLFNAVVSLESGNWTFTLQANISSSKYESTIIKTIVEGENLLNFVMKLQEKGNSNDSSINVLLSFEQNSQVNKVKAALYDIGMQNQIAGYEEELLQITNNSVCYNKTNVPSGEYILKVDFYGSDDIYLGTYKELVVTVSGCESNAIRDITLENFYTIEYQLNGGNWVTGFTAPACYNRFSDDIELPIPTREGYLFSGWYTNEEFTNKITTIESNRNENVSVFAKWDLINYSITYELNGGTNNETNPKEYTIEDTVILEKPSNDGYIFVGWYKDSEFTQVITQINEGSVGDVTLYARWTLNAYSITYNLNGGQNSNKNPKMYTNQDSVVFENATKEGYSFKGWYKDSNFINKVTRITSGTTGDITLYAKWSLINYSINYNLDGGTNNAENPSNYTIENSVNLKNPTKTGYTFVGWYKDSEFTQRISAISVGNSGNLSLYAKWEVIDYTIIYNLDDGINATQNPNSYTVENSIIFVPPEKRGYIFLGWYSDSLFENKIEQITSGTIGDITLYAKWIGGFVVDISNADSFDATVLKDGDIIIIQGSYFSSAMNVLVEKLKTSNVQFSLDLSGLEEFDSIGAYAFRDCSGLTSITIPDSVTSIGSSAFEGCSGLTNITIPDGVTSIGDYAFCDSGLTSITIPDSVTSIEESAFRGCSGLTTITIPDSVTSIEESAFRGCSGLTTITIPDGVTSIGDYAFCDSGLTSITIPDSVTIIGERVFDECRNLVSVIIPDDVVSIGDSAFHNCTSLPYVTIPDSVIRIGNYAFQNCIGLKGITIPDSVISIGEYAFSYCRTLTSITIPDSVTMIGGVSAFYGCTSLTSIAFSDPTNWYYTTNYEDYINKTNGTLIDLSDSESNAAKFKEYEGDFYGYYFYKK